MEKELPAFLNIKKKKKKLQEWPETILQLMGESFVQCKSLAAQLLLVFLDPSLGRKE
jgi:hypothetical protein